MAEILTTLLHTHANLVAGLAQSWLAAGATSMSLWDNSGMRACWSTSGPFVAPGLAACIHVGRTCIGELRVSGLNGPVVQTRLDADAAMIGQLARLDNEMETITGELIETQDQLLALYALNHSTRGNLHLEETLQALTREAAHLIKAEVAAIGITTTNTLTLYTAPGAGKITLSRELRRCIQASDYDLLLTDAHDPVLRAAGITNLCVVPIYLNGTVTAGGLGLANKVQGGFRAPDRKLAQAIAEQIGALIERSLLYQDQMAQTRLRTEMDLARQVQVRLLPHRPPLVPGLEVAAQTRPALDVGGDFYDFIYTPGRPFIFTVGDVAGKGISAALLMTTTRTSLRSKGRFLPDPTPVAMIGRANEELYDDFTEVGMFATVFVGQYDPAEGRLLYANAAHTPVIYCPAGGSARLLEPDAPALGVLPVSLCELHSVPLGPGDLLIAASDGFSEAHNPQDDLFGYERLLQLAEAHAGQSAQNIVATFFKAIDRFSAGAAQTDDQTIVVVKGGRPNGQ